MEMGYLHTSSISTTFSYRIFLTTYYHQLPSWHLIASKGAEAITGGVALHQQNQHPLWYPQKVY